MSAAEKAIRNAYAKLAAKPGDWVSLADLRDQLNIPRADVDIALKSLNRQSGVSLIPESEQSGLTQRDRDAALKLGGQMKHNIAIERTSSEMWRI